MQIGCHTCSCSGPTLRTPVTIVTRISASLDSSGLHHLLIASPIQYLYIPQFHPWVSINVVYVPRPDAVLVLFQVSYLLNIHSLYLLLFSQRLSSQNADITILEASGSFLLVTSDPGPSAERTGDASAGSTGFHALTGSRGFLASVGSTGSDPKSYLSRLVGLPRLSQLVGLGRQGWFP